MRAIVTIEFCDRETGEVRKVGDIIELTADRFNEIRKAGHYVDAYEEPRKPAAAKK